MIRFIIFLSRQSRYAPPRVGGFSYSNEYAKHLYGGRDLSLEEFNEACVQLFELGRGVPQHLRISCQAIAAPERAREDDGTFKADDPATPDLNEAYDPPLKRETKKTKLT